MKMNLPIICINLNNSTKADNREPAWFGDYPRIHVPFKEVMIRYAIDNWPLSVKNNNYRGTYHYRDYVYQMMGVW